MQLGRPWILMTGHGISCQKSKFPYLYFLIRYSVLSLCTDIPPPSEFFWGRGDICTQSILFSVCCTSLCRAIIFTNILFDEVFFFLNYRYSSLRLVPAYNKFIQERFERCLDLYLCPRQRKMRVSLIKKNKGIHLLLGLFCNQFSSLDYNTVMDFKKPQRLNVRNAKMTAVRPSNKTLINDKYMYHNHICLFKVTTYCSLKCTLWSSQQNTINIVFLTNVQYCSLFFRSK